MTIEQSGSPSGMGTSSTATVLVVDDDPLFLRAMKRLLESAAYSVETFESARALLQREKYLGWGCVIADLRMPGESGLDLQEQLNQLDYTLPIIFMTGAGDIESSVSAMKHGAVDFLTKPVENEVLFSAIAEAIEKDCCRRALFDRQVEAKEKIGMLTRREQEVMHHVVAGLPNKLIAYDLGISEKTVKAHRGQVMRKAGARSIIDLVAIEELASGLTH